ncbi:ABC transporter substrate-binding protein [Nocardioides sp. B-3]|uniref:ABC transporter substrate-binding protein n=1 Tax=Nocardioides sp. B-3 TaxID=2895565 RepID=UPI003FA55A17
MLEIAADNEGLETEVLDVAWETITTGEALNSGQCDVGAGAMTINPEREAVMDFTDPYFKATRALMTKTGAGITSLEDLAGKKVAVQDGTTGAEYVRENAPKDTEVISYEDSSLMQQAVLTGRSTPASTTTACSTTSSARTPRSRSSRSSRPARNTASR